MVRLCMLAMVVATKSQTELLRSGTIQMFQVDVGNSSILLFYSDPRIEFEEVLAPEPKVPENNDDNIRCIRAHIVAKLCRKQRGHASVANALPESTSSKLRLFQEGRRLGGAQRQKQV